MSAFIQSGHSTPVGRISALRQKRTFALAAFVPGPLPNGRVTFVEGTKLTVAFDKAGEKRVIDQFVSRT